MRALHVFWISSRQPPDNSTVGGFEIVFRALKNLEVILADSFYPHLVVLDECSGVTLEIFQDFMKKSLGYQSPFSPKKIVVIVPKDDFHREVHLSLQSVLGVIKEDQDILSIVTQYIADLVKGRTLHTKKALCISGGGVEGYIYSVGVIRAFEDVVQNMTAKDFDLYTGVSSGAMLSTSFAMGLTGKELSEQLYGRHPVLKPISLPDFVDFAFDEAIGQSLSFFKGIKDWKSIDFLKSWQSLVPVGFFRGEKLRLFIEEQFKLLGQKNEFSAINKELYILAAEQDTGEVVVFGEDPWRDVPLSHAIRASTALPPFYLPYNIKGHWFTDGQLVSSGGYEIPSRRACGFMFVVEPMVSFKTDVSGDVMKKGGYFTILQAIKSLVQSRAECVLNQVAERNPIIDIVIFKPSEETMVMMSGAPMDYTINVKIMEKSYEETLSRFVKEYGFFSNLFKDKGIEMKEKGALELLLKNLV